MVRTQIVFICYTFNNFTMLVFEVCYLQHVLLQKLLKIRKKTNIINILTDLEN